MEKRATRQLRRVPGQGARSVARMRQDAAFFDDREPVLVYIAGRLKEALKLEDAFTKAGIDYSVEPDQYTGGIIFRSERTGAFFCVAEESAEAARGVLREDGCKTLA
jgi:hypothetical protein